MKFRVWCSPLWCRCFTSVLVVQLAAAQTAPVDGIRKNTPNVHAFTNARIVQAPGRVIEQGTLVVRDGLIEDIGANIAVPKDARVWEMKGMSLYPGLIDGYSEYGMPKPTAPTEGLQGPQPKPPDVSGARHWNAKVLSQVNAEAEFSPEPKAAEKLRSQGFTSALAVPGRGIFKGASAVVNLGDGKANELLVKSNVAHHVTLTPEGAGEDYPGSLMGVIAIIRQTLYDAEWYQRAHAAYATNPGLVRPETNEALASLKNAAAGKSLVIMEASDGLNFLRSNNIAKEFHLQAAIRGSGDEYKRIDLITSTRRPVILPLNFPEAPSVQTPEEALRTSLAELRHWDEAPENPKRLHDAGVQFVFTSAMLKDPAMFLSQVRKAVERGLPADAALAALTTGPAKLFGVEKQLGSLEVGKLANFVVADGDLFAEKTRIRESWIDGKRYDVKPFPQADVRGKWTLTLPAISTTDTLHLKGEAEAPQGIYGKGKHAKLSATSLVGMTFAFSFPGDSVGYPGVVRMTANVDGQLMTGRGEWSDGRTFVWSAIRVAPFVSEPDTTKPQPVHMASFPPVYPHGEFGRPSIPEQPSSVLVKNATLWTCAPRGKLQNSDMLVQKGRIVSIGTGLTAPPGAVVIDAAGKHVTPGIIDPHSHMAGSGALNEAGQAVSAEVRIGDVIDPDDIGIYRALAGGETATHVLHGSANPIGGQCQLIKLRWGLGPEEMKFEGAPPTIKFALGENVKQSNWGDRYTTRYPQTRMGVEQLMRDEFQAALDYEKAWQRYDQKKAGIPPRRDLELDAMLEILKGKRLVHCHSYRQDEILAMIRVAEDFGFTIQAFQHILEGYKVADAMAKHGAGGSSFSDWWAYKLEVYDAIPYNPALMHQQGVLVSLNSDSDELTRRLNTEAAKAVKYGGVSEEEALKFVTLNPAKQLKVDGRVGSLEPGKDADFALWNAPPLSTFAVCEQTWIDGRKYFDREEDKLLQEEVQRQRAVLIQKVLTTKKSGGSEPALKPVKGSDEVEHREHRDGEEAGR